MLNANIKITKLQWFFTTAGLLLYMVDICTDVALALKYYNQENFIWMGLTLVFVLAGLILTQIFSYAWYREDIQDHQVNPGMSKSALAIVHIFGMGIITRHYHLLKEGFAEIWMTTPKERKNLSELAATLTILKMFETFLESVPQLLLQLYITLCHDEISVMQCLSMTFSFFNTAWVLVDYWRCLHKSSLHNKEMPSVLHTLVYLLYKLCTVTSHIFSCCLLLILSSYSSVGLAVLWLLGITWMHILDTNLCSSKRLEWLYRAVGGLILVVTFFNASGQNSKQQKQNSKVAVIIYYSFYTVLNIAAPILLSWLKPLEMVQFLFPVCGIIFGGTLLGVVFLTVYYVLLDPTGESCEVDEVDVLGKEAKNTLGINCILQEKDAEATLRIKRFLQP
ncbi:XK-related protein 9 [Thalassophryne amazonica]|uniref:XK-related protein 9 n=1 Tax=Thalassophryne amazonica TaxID=390379 RepID=UPI0014718C13|nr:XK-related protein 9 [Thalassophryne amazonica]